MDTQRAFLAIVLSLAILLGYQYFFLPPQAPQPVQEATDPQAVNEESTSTSAIQPIFSSPNTAVPAPAMDPARQGKDIPVETSLFSAVISENGGGIKSFKLKNYNEELDPASGFKELIKTESAGQLPLYFSWGAEPEKAVVPLFQADKKALVVTNYDTSLTLTSQLTSGVKMIRTMTFSEDDYLIHLTIDVQNTSTEHQVQGAPFLAMTNEPFSKSETKNAFLFQGPALYNNGVLEEIKMDDLADGQQIRNGLLDWVAFEDTYFMTAMIPDNTSQATARFSMTGSDTVSTVLSGNVVLLPPQSHKSYSYTIYFGPKKLSTLSADGHNLEKIINFGWFDILAKPMLALLNFLYGYINNYGWAIILVTVIIKILFWPIAHKGMKSMKTMQKLQPKMAKLREKYADNKDRLNQEMIQLYKTYKVNPLGGCLPMVLQIPIFFALYKVLLQTIELRHAPFMLWITDLSAPDRLFIGLDIPYLGGIPVLTLLMGASMFLQQKMTPTAMDPTQAKIMMFLPVVFTFMFLNFASGLVLYWFLNNLLSIGQQYAINKAPD